MKQKSSIIERLKIAWYALTLNNYIYVGLKEEHALFDNDGNYIGVASGSIKSYSYAPLCVSSCVFFCVFSYVLF